MGTTRLGITGLIFLLISASVYFAQSPVLPQQNEKKQEAKPKYEKISSHIILISISGLRADDVNNSEAYRLRIPVIMALRAKGAYAVSVDSVYPSLTGPAHATIATGTLPADHGVTSDFPFDEHLGKGSSEPFLQPKEGKNETIWALVKRGGFVTAAVGFPLTTGSTIDLNLPVDKDALSRKADGDAFTANKGLKEITEHQKLDYLNAVSAARLIEKNRPNLLTLNFASYERAVKKYGGQSKEAMMAIEFIDGLVKKIILAIERAQLTNEATLILVSDYGWMKIENIFNPNVVLAKKGWLTVDSQGQIASWRAVAQTFGGSSAIFVKNPQDEKTMGEIEKVFIEYHQKPESPIWRVVTRREVSKLGADPRAAFYLDAAPLYAFSSRTTGSTSSNPSDRAANGHLPSRSEMRATLVISGKGIKPGSKIEYARLIDIAPTVARLLGLEMRTAKGRVLSEVIDK